MATPARGADCCGARAAIAGRGSGMPALLWQTHRAEGTAAQRHTSAQACWLSLTQLGGQLALAGGPGAEGGAAPGGVQQAEHGAGGVGGAAGNVDAACDNQRAGKRAAG